MSVRKSTAPRLEVPVPRLEVPVPRLEVPVPRLEVPVPRLEVPVPTLLESLLESPNTMLLNHGKVTTSCCCTTRYVRPVVVHVRSVLIV